MLLYIMKNICDWNNCNEIGEYKAPVEKDNSKKFRMLCLEHVKEFNKNWNYFSGMNDDQVMDFLKSDMIWHKPTQSFSSSDNFFNDQKRKVNYEYIPKAVFTIPEISTVGLSEKRAKEIYSEKNIKIFKCKFPPMSNTFNKNKSKCMLKSVVHKLTDKVLGCHMFGETSSEIIQMVSISLNAGITKKDFDITMALHPTISEEFVTMYGKNNELENLNFS